MALELRSLEIVPRLEVLFSRVPLSAVRGAVATAASARHVGVLRPRRDLRRPERRAVRGGPDELVLAVGTLRVCTDRQLLGPRHAPATAAFGGAG